MLSRAPAAGNFLPGRAAETAFLPRAGTRDFRLSYLIYIRLYHLARRLQRIGQPPAWESLRRLLRQGWPREGVALPDWKGRMPMENALLVGLSRQVALARELDVVANNIANLNTTGFKADGSLFEEYLDAGARAPIADRRPRQLRARPRHLARHEPRADRADRQSARRRHRRQRLPGRADAARRALHPQRLAADQRHRPARHQRRQSGARRRRPDHVPADRPQISISRDGTISVREGNSKVDSARGKLRLVTFDNPQQLQKDGSSTFNATGGAQPQTDDDAARRARRRSRNRTCAAWSR